ncbi:hypothetical protein F511_37404 [Dorcoceras hygrometricum]|uniref:Uncharacterized protein n=1 Tax=Dorcoceras hygrometricum TaxID=472368 RepID=A0A2Z7B338_9LAMI|nr:hypothetical protein F511_37404 [Dorcoceras hygrometricum]
MARSAEPWLDVKPHNVSRVGEPSRSRPSCMQCSSRMGPWLGPWESSGPRGGPAAGLQPWAAGAGGPMVGRWRVACGVRRACGLGLGFAWTDWFGWTGSVSDNLKIGFELVPKKLTTSKTYKYVTNYQCSIA